MSKKKNKDDRAKHEGSSTKITQQTYSNPYQEGCQQRAAGLFLRVLEEISALIYRQPVVTSLSVLLLCHVLTLEPRINIVAESRICTTKTDDYRNFKSNNVDRLTVRRNLFIYCRILPRKAIACKSIS